MIAAVLLVLALLTLAATLRALRLLPNRARDQWHHAWFGLVTLGVLLARLPWRWGQLLATGVAAFCGLCLLDDAIQHGVQAWRYDRATSGAERVVAMMYRSPLHRLARAVGWI